VRALDVAIGVREAAAKTAEPASLGLGYLEHGFEVVEEDALGFPLQGPRHQPLVVGGGEDLRVDVLVGHAGRDTTQDPYERRVGCEVDDVCRRTVLLQVAGLGL